MNISHHDADYHNKNTLFAIVMVCIGYMFMSQSQILAKVLGHKYHFAEVVFMSQVAFFAFIFLYGLKTEGMGCFKTKKPGLMLLRGIIGKVSVFINFLALPHINLASFYTIIFTTPLWITIFATVFLKDRVGAQRLSATMMGLAVVIYIFRPWRADLNPWSLLIFISAIASAIEMVIIRYIGAKESRSFMIGIGALVGMVVSAPFMMNHYIQPSLFDLCLMFSSGIFMALDLLFIAYAYQNVSTAAIIAPYQYTQIAWGALFGYFIFKEIPHKETVLGATLIIVIGIYLIYNERKFKYKRGKVVAKTYVRKHHKSIEKEIPLEKNLPISS